MTHWHLESWLGKPQKQVIQYPDDAVVKQAIQTLSLYPPLVTDLEINALKSQLALASQGKAFVLQGGDCAESFDECTAANIVGKLKILLQMSLILLHGMRKPIVRIGRIAGQYAKPRSADTETQNGVTLPSYRGDLINRPEFTEAARIPNPDLMLQGYSYSAATLNYVRALIDGGFANLQHPEFWNIDFFEHTKHADEYQKIVDSINDALGFLQSISGLRESSINRVDFYTSHEALNLYYEQALTRKSDNGWFDQSTHLPWIGARTNDPDGAHVEFLRGINNPVGVKVGPDVSAKKLQRLIERLNPENEAGRLVLIHRFGAEHIKQHLPDLIKAVQATQSSVLWICDPMHGNTMTTKQGIKTRSFNNILSELKDAFAIHADMGSYLGGVHFELTGEDVTECLGGARGLEETDLPRAYKSLVDPRLNYEQALEMAMLIARK